MSLEMQRGPRPNGLVADRRLYVSRDRARLIEDGGPDAAYLLAAGRGDMISADDVAALGLSLVDGRVVQGQPEPEPEPDPPQGDSEGASGPASDETSAPAAAPNSKRKAAPNSKRKAAPNSKRKRKAKEK